MKTMFLILLSITGIFSLSAQERDSSIYLLSSAVKKPEFPGGDLGFVRYINTHINFPQTMADTLNNEKVDCIVIIDQDGKVIPGAISKRSHNLLSRKVWEVLQKIPDFIPGETERGKRKFEYPLIFLFTTDTSVIHLRHTYSIFIPVFPTDNPEYQKLLNQEP